MKSTFAKIAGGVLVFVAVVLLIIGIQIGNSCGKKQAEKITKILIKKTVENAQAEGAIIKEQEEIEKLEKHIDACTDKCHYNKLRNGAINKLKEALENSL